MPELTDDTKDALKDQAADFSDDPKTPEEDPKVPEEDPKVPDEDPKETPDEDLKIPDDQDEDPDAIDFKPDEDAKAAEKKAEEARKKKEVEATRKMNAYIYESVGGEAKFKALASTIKGSLDTTELESLNAKLRSGNKVLVNEALSMAVSKYKKIKGYGGNKMEGDAAAVKQEKELMITKEDYRQIMRTEKYKTDPLYRDKIDAARLKTREADKKRYGPGMYYGFNQNGRYEL